MRNATLDHARLWAAFGIVLFHSGAAGSAMGYAALPFFLMLLMVMALPGAARLDLKAFAQGRAERLLRPWILWSAVYGALKLAEVAATGKPLASEFQPFMLLTGPAIHLWFLPFAFVACLAMHPLSRLPGTARTFGLMGLVGLGLALAALALHQSQRGPLPQPLAQWVFALPAVGLGIGFALARGRALRLAALIGAAAAAGALALALGWAELGWTGGLGQLALAGAALAACLLLPTRETALSRRSADLAMGVYLCHPLVASVLGRVTDLASDTLAMAGLTMAGAVLLTLGLEGGAAALRRIPARTGLRGLRAGQAPPRPAAPPLAPAS